MKKTAKKPQIWCLPKCLCQFGLLTLFSCLSLTLSFSAKAQDKVEIGLRFGLTPAETLEIRHE